MLCRTLVHELTHAFLFSYGMQSSSYTEDQVGDVIGTYGKEILRLAYEHMRQREG